MFNEIIYKNESIITALGWTLLHSIWQIAFVALFLLLFLRSNKSSASLRYNVLATTILLIPVLSALTFSFYFENSKNVIPTDFLYLPLTAFDLSQSATVTITEQLTNGVNNYSSIIVTLWFTGILILLLRFVGGLYYTKQLKKSGLITISEDIITTVNNFRILSGISRPVSIFESVLIKVPVAIGYLKPVILLPAGTITGIPPSQLEAILAHEIAHIKRSDYLHNLINSLIEIIFFYHPAIWWISNRLNEERENCCDDIAISITGNSAELAWALAGLSQNFNHHQHILAMTGKQNHILERIKRLTGIKKSARKLSYHSYVFLIITALAAGIALTVNASIQEPDSFMKTTHRITAGNLIDVPENGIIQDTVKTKKKQIPAPAKAKRLESSDDTGAAGKNNVLSDAEREKLEAEMEKLAAEMEKLGKQMSKLHEQLGTSEWDNFDFDFNFDLDSDSIRIKINEDLTKELALVKVYTDKAIKEAIAGESKARTVAKAHSKRTHAEAKAAGKNMIIIEKEIASAEKTKAKARKLKMKAESNQLEEELRKDGLITGEHFTLKLDNTGMYVDGKKQSEDIYRKYTKIIMSDFEEEDDKYLENSEFNIHIIK